MTLLYDDFGSHAGDEPGLEPETIDIFLDPGEYFVGDALFKPRTLLGSCVSMILWHPRLQFGAMSHVILPTRVGPRSSDSESVAEPLGKYADEVLELMIDELQHAGVPLQQCQAKIFGGGNMFPRQKVNDRLNIGKRNGEAAQRLVKACGIPIVAQDLYGIGHRQVIFNVRNGDVWMRQFPL